MKATALSWGMTPDGEEVELHTLANDREMSVSICTYGGAVTSIILPDRDGNLRDVVLGYGNLDAYLADTMYLGPIIGRTANRIGQSCIKVQGQTFSIDRNHGAHTLHGGSRGFHTRVWQAESGKGEDTASLSLHLASPHMDQGYPGNLEVTATYTLDNDNTLALAFQAETDRPTLVDLTSHTYFNLSGHDSGSCTGHTARFNAETFLETDAELIPTGTILPTAGTGLDMEDERELAANLALDDPMMRAAGGFDHFYVLRSHPELAGRLIPAATIRSLESGIRMNLATDNPGFQFYSGNFIPDAVAGKNGATYTFRSGFCMEPHRFIDSSKHPAFPSQELLPGETYRRTIEYRFSLA